MENTKFLENIRINFDRLRQTLQGLTGNLLNNSTKNYTLNTSALFKGLSYYSIDGEDMIPLYILDQIISEYGIIESGVYNLFNQQGQEYNVFNRRPREKVIESLKSIDKAVNFLSSIEHPRDQFYIDLWSLYN